MRMRSELGLHAREYKCRRRLARPALRPRDPGSSPFRKAPDTPALQPMTALPLVPAQIDAESSHR